MKRWLLYLLTFLVFFGTSCSKESDFFGDRVELLQGAGNVFRGITKTQFFETVPEFINPANGLLGDQAWDLWKAKNWGALEDLF